MWRCLVKGFNVAFWGDDYLIEHDGNPYGTNQEIATNVPR